MSSPDVSRPRLPGPAARGDRTLQLLVQGYAFPGRVRGSATAVRTWLLGQPAVLVGGREGARLFYDTSRFQRAKAIPRPVRRTLFGEGAVHGLDDEAHRVRKTMLLSAVSPESVARLTAIAERRWDEVAATWPARGRVVLFDEATRVLAGSALEWAGAAPTDEQLPSRTQDLVAMVDGFGGGPRHVSARQARKRAERWAGALVRATRAGRLSPPPGSPLAVVSAAPGLDERLAAVELLNLVRPTVAVAWFVAFEALALHTHPEWQVRLRGAGEEVFTAFADEVRRLYPFVPVLGARARHAFTAEGQRFRKGQLTVLDVYGTDHDPALWPDPERFDPDRFLAGRPDAYSFLPQGGGDPGTGHRCPGEGVTVAMMVVALRLLLRVAPEVPPQDLTFRLSRMPTRPRSGVVLHVR